MAKSQHTKISREPEIFGYIRVSTREQNIDRQLLAMEPHCIPPANLFIEKKSGKNFERPQYRQMLRKLRKGDLVIFCELDRLGRDYNEIIEQWRYLTREKGVDIKVLEMPLLDTTYYKDLLGTFIADLVLSVLSFTAQKEREKHFSGRRTVLPPPKPKAWYSGARLWKCRTTSRQYSNCGAVKHYRASKRRNYAGSA